MSHLGWCLANILLSKQKFWFGFGCEKDPTFFWIYVIAITNFFYLIPISIDFAGGWFHQHHTQFSSYTNCLKRGNPATLISLVLLVRHIDGCAPKNGQWIFAKISENFCLKSFWCYRMRHFGNFQNQHEKTPFPPAEAPSFIVTSLLVPPQGSI